MYTLKTSDIEPLKNIGYFFQHTNKRKLYDGLHAHDFYEFFYITSGSCVHIIDSHETVLSAGALVGMRPGISHKSVSHSDDTDILALSVSAHETEKILNFYGMSTLPEPFYAETLPIDCQNMLMTQSRALLYGESGTAACRLFLNQLLIFILSPNKKRDALPAPLATALEKIQYSDISQYGVEPLLSLSGYSHSQLCRLMQKHFSLTPTEYINRIRMRRAYSLATDTDMSLEAICSEVGFESTSYFCKLFKKSYGCTLSDLRKNISCRTV